MTRLDHPRGGRAPAPAGRPANPAPTRPPTVAADAAIWPAWTATPITRALTILDAVGTPLRYEGGRR